MTVNRPAIWLSVAGVLGLIVGYGWPPPPIPRTAADTAAWSVPSAERMARYSPESFAKITREMRWGTGPLSGDGQSTNWRLAGFLISDEAAILVMDPKVPTQTKRVAIGEKLPDGSTLHVIDGDRITTQLDACERIYQLYQLTPISSSSGCESDPAPDASDKEPVK